MISTITPIRKRQWTPPPIHTKFRNRGDGSVWEVTNIYRMDQQVKLERDGYRPCYPFPNMLAADWDQLGA